MIKHFLLLASWHQLNRYAPARYTPLAFCLYTHTHDKRFALYTYALCAHAQVFGLHDNANISCALAETGSLLDTALSLQPRTAAGAGKSWDDVLSELAADISSRLPRAGTSAFDVERAALDFPVLYSESMNTVLTQVRSTITANTANVLSFVILYARAAVAVLAHMC
jgi:Dynein heavy chain C-terminal domain